MTKKVRTTTIGVSGFGNHLYNEILRARDAGRVEFIGATIRNQARDAEKVDKIISIGGQVFSDYKEMFKTLAGDIDLAVIPTGINFHKPMTLAALDIEANVMVEKPAAATVQEVNDMIAAEKASGKFVAVGFQDIFQPEVQAVKRALVNGRIGKIKTVKAVGMWPRDCRYYHRNDWAGKFKAGNDWILDSPACNALAHYLNLCCFFAGDTFDESAELEWIQAGLVRANPEIENADTTALHVKGKNGVDIFFFANHTSEEWFDPIIDIEGTEGHVHWEMKKTVITTKSNTEEIENTVAQGREPYRDNVLKSCCAKVNDPSTFVCTLQIAEKHTRCINGAHESAAVLPVPSDEVRKIVVDAEAEAYRYVIPGIDDVFKRCYAENRLPNEKDYAWWKNGEKFDISSYKEFKGGKTGQK